MLEVNGRSQRRANVVAALGIMNFMGLLVFALSTYELAILEPPMLQSFTGRDSPFWVQVRHPSH